MFRDQFLQQQPTRHNHSEDDDGEDDHNQDHHPTIKSSFTPSPFTILHWDTTRSHPKLQISTDGHCISRSDHFEMYPVAMARSLSTLTTCTCQVKYDRKLTKDFSIGVVDVDVYQYDYNLADCVGNLMDTWGISEGTDGFMLLKAHGKVLKRLPVLQSNDILTFHIDLHSSPSTSRDVPSSSGGNKDWSDDFQSTGSCQIYFNHKLVATIYDLDTNKNYAIASTLSPLYSIDILTENEQTQRSTQDEEDDVWNDFKSTDHQNHYNHTDMSLIQSESKDSTHHSSDNAKAQPSTSNEQSRASPPVPSFFPTSKSLLAPPPSAMLPAINAASKTTTSTAAKPSDTKDSSNSTGGGMNMDCCICLSASKCVLFMPCKHICVCEECGMKQKPEIKVCPMCRLSIKTKIKVFI